jgi:CBS domain-containing protein
MNVLFFLTPKNDVAYIDSDVTLRQALEKLEANGYTALPIVTKRGKYIGSITEGDLLWYIKDHANLTLFDAEDVPLSNVERKRNNQAVSINAKMEDLWEKVLSQNFVPVIDDEETFIGIVTRRDVMMQLVRENQHNVEVNQIKQIKQTMQATAN